MSGGTNRAGLSHKMYHASRPTIMFGSVGVPINSCAETEPELDKTRKLANDDIIFLYLDDKSQHRSGSHHLCTFGKCSLCRTHFRCHCAQGGVNIVIGRTTIQPEHKKVSLLD